MTDGIIRIKSSRQGYRRGGLDHGRDWAEIDTADLTAAQKRAVLGDPVLTIESREEDGSWSPLSAEIREGLAVLLDPASGIEGTEESFQVDEGVVAKADRYDALLAQISLHQPDLEGLKLWPVEHVDNLVVALIGGLGEAEGVISDRDDELARGSAVLSLAGAIEPHETALFDLGIPFTNPGEVIPRLIAALLECRSALSTLDAELSGPWQVAAREAFAVFRAELQDPATVKMAEADLDDRIELIVTAEAARIRAELAPAGAADQSQQDGPEAAGATSPAGASTPPAEPAPTPKRKPPAKGQPGDSKPS